MNPKKITQGLLVLEILLLISALVGIKSAQLNYDEKGLIYFLVMATIAALFPATLAMLCEGMRYLVKIKMDEEYDEFTS